MDLLFSRNQNLKLKNTVLNVDKSSSDAYVHFQRDIVYFEVHELHCQIMINALILKSSCFFLPLKVLKEGRRAYLVGVAIRQDSLT